MVTERIQTRDSLSPWQRDAIIIITKLAPSLDVSQCKQQYVMLAIDHIGFRNTICILFRRIIDISSQMCVISCGNAKQKSRPKYAASLLHICQQQCYKMRTNSVVITRSVLHKHNPWSILHS